MRRIVPVGLLLVAAASSVAQFAAVPEPEPFPDPEALAVPAPVEPRYQNPPFAGPEQLDVPPAVPGYAEPPRPTWRHRGAAVMESMPPLPRRSHHPWMGLSTPSSPAVPAALPWGDPAGPSIEPAPPPNPN